uniref:sciellin n=1 Tax=Semicossyphus pulcher TaxID=241346 RepID=UPI0037E76D88
MSRFSNKSSLLKDNSWIRRDEEEEEDVDRDPNFGKSILSQYKSGETPQGVDTEEVKPPQTKPTSSSVHALSKRFGGSQDELSGSPYSSVKSSTTTTTTKVTKDGKTTETTFTTTESPKSPVIKSPTSTFTERVLRASNKGQQYAPFSPTKTTKVTETTVTTNKDPEDKLFDTLIPKSVKYDIPPIDSKTTVTTTETVPVKSSPDTDAEDKLFDTLIPSSTRDDYSPTDSKTTISSTETVTVRSSINGDVKTSTTTRTSSTPEDDLYSTLLPRAITSGLNSPISSDRSSSITKREIITVESSRGVESPTLSSPSSTRKTSYSSYADDIPSTRTTSYTVSTKPSDDYDSDRKSFSYTRPDSSYEYSSINSPSSYTSTTYRSSSRSDDSLSDPIYSKSSKSLYSSSDRTVHEKDLCTVCRRPFTGEAKMVLEDIKINCHATCFKCQVCNNTLAHLKAGDSMWVYKQTVHCDNCFENTREKWQR